ncbi:acylneuraminate cytidylyltransferase family protein [Peptococcaceae bacterium 1198_IL3148]
MTEKVVCIIPGKGGSTRFPRKNVYPLLGKPLIAYTIEAAKESDLFNDIYVSTEDEEIKEVSQKYGASVPYLRPEYLSKDPAGVVDVCLHMLDYLGQQGKVYDTLIILLPTSPLRNKDDIKNAYEKFLSSKENFLMSVCEFEHSPYRSMRLNEDGTLKPNYEQYIKLKSQELPKSYRVNGAITIVNIESFKKEKSYFTYPLQSYVMPVERSVDIDNISDLLYAEYLLKCIKS